LAPSVKAALEQAIVCGGFGCGSAPVGQSDNLDDAHIITDRKGEHIARPHCVAGPHNMRAVAAHMAGGEHTQSQATRFNEAQPAQQQIDTKAAVVSGQGRRDSQKRC
jgi:hypothetical protein